MHVRLKEDFPDYVFSDNYQLMPLPTLKSYIKANAHLPGIPSADEVEQNGLDLGEMNRILVEKVEELTLYLIKQQEEIEALKARLEVIEE